MRTGVDSRRSSKRRPTLRSGTRLSARSLSTRSAAVNAETASVLPTNTTVDGPPPDTHAKPPRLRPFPVASRGPRRFVDALFYHFGILYLNLRVSTSVYILSFWCFKFLMPFIIKGTFIIKLKLVIANSPNNRWANRVRG